MKLTKIIPALLWSGIIFFLCLLPGNKLPKEEWLDKIYFDKIIHAVLYFILYFLIIRIFKKPAKTSLLFAGFLCITQGILIEFLQGSALIQNRSFDVWDIGANILGIFAAIIFFCPKHKFY
jgi:VanZ family protein